MNSKTSYRRLYSDSPYTDLNEVPNSIMLEPMSKSNSSTLKTFVPYLFNWSSLGTQLDSYLNLSYKYFLGKGIYCILLHSLLNILTMVFIVSFTTFLSGCIDYSKLKPKTKLSDAIVERCLFKLPLISQLGLFLFALLVLLQIVKLIYETSTLLEMFRFFTQELGIPDEDMQTISWNEVVKRMSRLPSNSSINSIDINPYSVSQRLMRYDNYMIALINLEKLKFDSTNFLYTLTKGMEYNLSYVINSTFFDGDGYLIPTVLDKNLEKQWVEKLRNKFRRIGLLNLVFGPIFVTYTLIYLIFRYAEEYYKPSSELSIRQFTPKVCWQLREFNELQHNFEQRLQDSYPDASRYLDQFPKHKTDLVLRFLALVSGTFLLTFAGVAFFDSELTLELEIFDGLSILSLGTVFGVILSATRQPKIEPKVRSEILLARLLDHLHYMPKNWKEAQLHTELVRQEFAAMYKLKLAQLVEELLGLLLTPFKLFFIMPTYATSIVETFQECSVQDPELGLVCSLAKFDFDKHGDAEYGAPISSNVQSNRRDFVAKHGKLEKSLITFKHQNPDWIPYDPSTTIYLTNYNKLREQLHDEANADSFTPLDQMDLSTDLDVIQVNPLHRNTMRKNMMMRVLDMIVEQHRN